MSEAAPYCYEYPRPALTVDVVILRLSNYADCSSAECHEILLIQRAHPPFPGHWALPGGFVDEGETPQAAAMREAREETGLAVTALQEVGVFAEPGRDPRGWVVSVAFVTRLSGGSDAEAGDDAVAGEALLVHPEVGVVVRREGTREGRWALLDYNELVVHVQHVDERDYYSLDRLWKDCPVVEIEGVESGTRPAGEADTADDALAPEEPQRDQEL